MTDSSGQFEFETVGVGNYQLSTAHPSGAQNTMEIVVVEGFQEVEVVVN